MKSIKRNANKIRANNFISIFAVFFLLSLCLTGCSDNNAKTTESLKTNPISVSRDKDLGCVNLDFGINELQKIGFRLGDSVDVEFSSGKKISNIPFYNGYYAKVGAEFLLAAPEAKNPQITIGNKANSYDLWQITKGDKVTITLNERDKYKDIQEALDLPFSDNREDHSSDEAFANLRSLKGGSLKDGIFFRGASPCNRKFSRIEYVDKYLKENNIGLCIDLADNPEVLKNYSQSKDFSFSYWKSLYDKGLVVGKHGDSNFGDDVYKQVIKTTLTALLKNNGPYYVHCKAGKDRTGFFCVLIESLCGASYQEMLDDYMRTYDNYCHITKEKDEKRYQIISDTYFHSMLEIISGESDCTRYKDMNFESSARKYLELSGLSSKQIDQIRDKLTK